MKNAVRFSACAGLALMMTTAVLAAPDKPLKAIPFRVAAEGAAVKAIPYYAVVERITFENVELLDQALVLGWIDTRPGDILTPERIERIPARLRTLASPRSFTYKAGSKPGQVILSIGAGC